MKNKEQNETPTASMTLLDDTNDRKCSEGKSRSGLPLVLPYVHSCE
jgi:hypothetical protein